MARPETPVQLAVIGAAQGIKGAVRVKTFTGDPMALAEYGPLYDETGRRFDILDLRPPKAMLVARFKGISDRSAAEALNGTALFVDRGALPDDLEEEEFYHADLVGLDAVDREGATVGTVKAVLNFGGGDILDITRPGGGSVLVPFTKAAVPSVDLGGRAVVLDRIAAGLDDTGAAGDAPDSRTGRPRGPKASGGNR
ncbi:MAG: ribosome maturation factor RimM [Nitratireductor sp.]